MDDLHQQITPEVQEVIDQLQSEYKVCAMGTITSDGWPMITKARPMILNEQPYLLLSDLSEHTKNINVTDKVALYFEADELNKIKMNNPRLTYTGTLTKVDATSDTPQFDTLLSNYKKQNNGQGNWARFDDFNFYIMDVTRTLFVEGFGKAYLREEK